MNINFVTEPQVQDETHPTEEKISSYSAAAFRKAIVEFLEQYPNSDTIHLIIS